MATQSPTSQRPVDVLKVLCLMGLLWLPNLILPWTDHGLEPAEFFALAAFSFWLLCLPFIGLGRLRWALYALLPFVPWVPVYVFLCLQFRSVPGDALVSAALTSGWAQWREVLQPFLWHLLWLPLTLAVYLALTWSIPRHAALSRVWRKRGLLLVLLYALVGTAGRQYLGAWIPVPPLLEDRTAALAYPSGVVMSVERSFRHQRGLAQALSVNGRLRPEAPNGLVLVLVVGESVRADHLPFNGYARNTLPGLSAIGPALLSFSDVVSTAQWTSVAVPNIVSRPQPGGRATLLQTLAEAGFRTAWLSNQEPSPSSRFAHVAEHATSDRDFQLRRDMALLPMFESFLNQAGARQFIVLHMMGSHHPYEERYGAESRQFTPTLPPLQTSGHPGPEMKVQVINSYDNTLIETDRFLRRVIDRLSREGRPAVLLFVSDHGENLFDDERQVFMHAWSTPTRYDLAVPLLIWANPAYRQHAPERWSALEANRQRKLSHPDVFPTVLDLADVQWEGQREEDSFASLSFEEKPRILWSLDGPAGRFEDVR